MNTFIVFVRPKEDFNLEIFTEHMKGYATWARLNYNLWMVTFEGKSSQLRDRISTAVKKSCDIMVINISGDGWATLNINRNITDWMTENI